MSLDRNSSQQGSVLRLVMMGTGPFAVPTFRALYDTRHTVAALVTQPPRPPQGNRPAPVNPMRQVALEHGTPVFDPKSVNTPESLVALAQLEPDLFVVADYGQILSSEVLALPRLGGINLHGSLLPKYRGAAPINWAVYFGDEVTGVTVIHMTPRIDAGPCIAQASTPIDPQETAVELEARLAALGAPLVYQAIERLAQGDIASLTQDPAQASPARRLRKTDSEVDWSRSAEQIRNQIRALEPWPRTSTFWHRAGMPPVRLILGRATAQNVSGDAKPGTVLTAGREGLIVATGRGSLQLDEVQPAGKRMLAAAEFLRGYPVRPGDFFGPESSIAPDVAK
jgi:methionyl-tRNA formyltransferase